MFNQSQSIDLNLRIKLTDHGYPVVYKITPTYICKQAFKCDVSTRARASMLQARLPSADPPTVREQPAARLARSARIEFTRQSTGCASAALVSDHAYTAGQMLKADDVVT